MLVACGGSAYAAKISFWNLEKNPPSQEMVEFFNERVAWTTLIDDEWLGESFTILSNRALQVDDLTSAEKQKAFQLMKRPIAAGRMMTFLMPIGTSIDEFRCVLLYDITGTQHLFLGDAFSYAGSSLTPDCERLITLPMTSTLMH